MTVPLPRYPTDVIEEVSAMFAESRAWIEGDLICAVLADHRRAIRLAEGRGLTREHVQQPDFRAIYVAAEWAVEQHHDADMLGAGARLLLQTEHLWDPQQRADEWRRGRQSPRTLIHMATRFGFQRCDVERRVDALLQAVEHQREFAERVGGLIRYAGDVIDWSTVAAPEALVCELHAATDILRLVEECSKRTFPLTATSGHLNHTTHLHRKAVPA